MIGSCILGSLVVAWVSEVCVNGQGYHHQGLEQGRGQ